MKLQNKKTGEIMDDAQYRNYSLSDGFGFHMNGKEWEYHSLAELNEEWEDYEEPKVFWYIYGDQVLKAKCDGVIENMNKPIGNYFETKEEAEKAIEKLKAWKRLKDRGFEFEGTNNNKRQTGYFMNYYLGKSFNSQDECEQAMKDLDLLFGGEE